MKRITPYILIMLIAAVACTENLTPHRTGRIACKVSSEETRSMISTLDSIQSTGFKMMAWLDTDYYISDDETGSKGLYFDQTAQYTAGNWAISGEPNWVALDSTRFWCWSPASLRFGKLTVNPDGTDLTGKNKLTFTYQMPQGGATEGDPAVPCDANRQSDITFAYNSFWYDDNSSNGDAVNLKFYHCLSQINFIVYPVAPASQTPGDGSLRSDYTIEEIALCTISSEGTCNVTGNCYKTFPAAGTQKTTFVWSNQDEPDRYTQNYSVDFTAAESVITSKGWEKKTYSDKVNYVSKNSFFIIPQPIADDAGVIVTFKVSGKRQSRLVTLKGVGTSDGSAPVTEWLAGKRYTYRLGLSATTDTAPNAMTVTLEDWDEVNDPLRF